MELGDKLAEDEKRLHLREKVAQSHRRVSRASDSTSSVTHTFTTTGAKTVTVTAQDGYGVTTAKTLLVTVS